MADLAKELRVQLEKKVSEISEVVRDRAKEEFLKLETEASKQTNQAKITKEIDAIKEKIEDCDRKKERLQGELRAKKAEQEQFYNIQLYNIKDEAIRDIIASFSDQKAGQNYSGYGGRTSEPSFDCAKKLIETSAAYKNYAAFKQIKEDLWMNWGMTVSVKEKRALLLGFLSKDWQKMGINVPTPAYMSDFKVDNDGNIVLPTAPQLPAVVTEQ